MNTKTNRNKPNTLNTLLGFLEINILVLFNSYSQFCKKKQLDIVL